MAAEVPQRVLDTIWERIDVGAEDECWPWLLCIGTHGYGQKSWSIGGNRTAGTVAHRVAWMATHGPIPEGMHVDHLCLNRRCCNPSHLRLLTPSENSLEAVRRNRKPCCPRGHEFTPENTGQQRNGGGRFCRTCHRARVKAWKLKKRMAHGTSEDEVRRQVLEHQGRAK